MGRGKSSIFFILGFTIIFAMGLLFGGCSGVELNKQINTIDLEVGGGITIPIPEEAIGMVILDKVFLPLDATGALGVIQARNDNLIYTILVDGQRPDAFIFSLYDTRVGKYLIHCIYFEIGKPSRVTDEAADKFVEEMEKAHPRDILQRPPLFQKRVGPTI